MPLLSILSSPEQRRLNTPKRFTAEERSLYFTPAHDLKQTLASIRKTHLRLGFLLQLGYFRAHGKFFPVNDFYAADIRFAARMLGIRNIDLTQYVGGAVTRHRRQILQVCNWSPCDDDALAVLTTRACQCVKNQQHPKDIILILIDECWKRQIEVPSAFTLTEIVTDAFNAHEHELINDLKAALTRAHRQNLRGLMRAGAGGGKQHWRLTGLKKISQSLRPRDISESERVMAYFRSLYDQFAPIYRTIGLNDKATAYYADWARKASHRQLVSFASEEKSFLYVLAFVKHQYFQRQDALIDILVKSVTATKNAADAEVAKSDAAVKAERDLAIQALSKAHKSSEQFKNAVLAIIGLTDATPSEKYYKIEELALEFERSDDLDEKAINRLEDDLSRAARNLAYFDALQSRSRKLQSRVAAIMKSVHFDPASRNKPLLSAIDHFQETNGVVGANPPLTFLTPQERRAVFDDVGQFRGSLYKCLLFFHTAQSIKSGALNLVFSYRYRALDDYLIDRLKWRSERASILKATGLAEFENGQRVLDGLKETIERTYKTVNERYLSGDNVWMSQDAANRCRVRTPRTDFNEHSAIAASLGAGGYVPVLQVMSEADRITNFTSCFRHFSNKNAKLKHGPVLFIAGVIAKGCNIGVGKMAKISVGLKEHVLRNAVAWHFDLDNLRAANRRIVEAINALSLANGYLSSPPHVHSSSDGRKISVAPDCLHANYSYKYFGKEKGVTLYSFIDERQSLFHSQVFSASDREAPYVIDGLMENRILEGQIHSTDTHGYTEQIFAVSHLMKVAFAPRLKNIAQQRIYAFSARSTYKKKGYPLLPSRTIRWKLILEHWDDILRFVASINTQHASASQLFKRLSSYARDHPLYQALKEFGRLIKTQFILSYFDDVELRQRIQKQLNRVELSNKFSKAVYFDNDQTFQDASLENQEITAACKLIIQNAVILWNYLYLSEQIALTKTREDKKALISDVIRGSVITWRHVNFRGEYDFSPAASKGRQFDLPAIKTLNINAISA